MYLFSILAWPKQNIGSLQTAIKRIKLFKSKSKHNIIIEGKKLKKTDQQSKRLVRQRWFKIHRKDFCPALRGNAFHGFLLDFETWWARASARVGGETSSGRNVCVRLFQKVKEDLKLNCKLYRPQGKGRQNGGGPTFVARPEHERQRSGPFGDKRGTTDSRIKAGQ